MIQVLILMAGYGYLLFYASNMLSEGKAAWSKCPLGRARARPLRRRGARLVALGGVNCRGGEAAQGASSLGCSSEPPPKSPIPLPLARRLGVTAARA